MENSTKTSTTNKITNSSSTGKERSESNVSLSAHPFQTTTLEEERQMAKQTSHNLKTGSSVDALTTSPPSKPIKSRRKNHAQSSTKRSNSDQEHHHPIYTHDNAKLKYVLHKVLTSSDVNDQGRIVLPKREAEENFPRLDSKEGTLFVMKEVQSDTEWILTYRFWANHKGRIYLLYKCGEFVRTNMLKAGDKLTLYQDIFKNVYFTITRKENDIPAASNEHDKEDEGEAEEVMTSHEDGSYSTNKREDIPVFQQFL